MISKPVPVISFLFGVSSLVLWCNLVAADADGPDYWAVQDIPQGRALHLRKGPATQFPIVARIPSGFSHLENLGCSPPFSDKEWASFTEPERDLAVSLRWCRVQYEGQAGWVKGTYLIEGVPAKD